MHKIFVFLLIAAIMVQTIARPEDAKDDKKDAAKDAVKDATDAAKGAADKASDALKGDSKHSNPLALFQAFGKVGESFFNTSENLLRSIFGY